MTKLPRAAVGPPMSHDPWLAPLAVGRLVVVVYGYVSTLRTYYCMNTPCRLRRRYARCGPPPVPWTSFQPSDRSPTGPIDAVRWLGRVPSAHVGWRPIPPFGCWIGWTNGKRRRVPLPCCHLSLSSPSRFIKKKLPWMLIAEANGGARTRRPHAHVKSCERV